MIEIKNLCKSFKTSSDTFHALKDINMYIKKEEAILIYGHSGSGKSTLLSIIASLMKPTSGEVNVHGENIASLSDIHASSYRKNVVGVITQNFHLFDELRVEENLLAPLVLNDHKSSEISILIDKALKTANILHKKKQKVNTLSGGEKQRCIIARAIVNNPDIIICDEPTANLDETNSLLFMETLKELKHQGKTLIIATHDPLFKTQEFVDRVLTMKEGSLG